MCYKIDFSEKNWKMKGNQKVITDKLRDDDDAASIENDWKFAAMVSFPIIRLKVCNDQLLLFQPYGLFSWAHEHFQYYIHI